ncbi:efflux RND transporter periplasmic adaptor subunit [Methylocystis parvus]|uniref:Efflux RND transporter periplasmic adaptor subunit n=1 Tax=Methylocystis parvus TaxID=134 RepID=A0A6B8M3Q9_9HYPH|nr:efflux RND transporter periplasmic adaptor subunit [Methylocystis parvus]QGM96985.1 efflux RND transporter periplasmic adaptor subunit [Methylocystis parvus]WBJ99124.1 efflux RND transporter periplasmic adaptor subunit [Methylocystis parvus OBBP]
MYRRTPLLLAILASLAVGAALPGLFAKFRGPGAEAPAQSVAGGAAPGADGLIKLSPEQVEAAKIGVAKAGPGVIKRQIAVPAAVKPDPDHLARVAAKVAGVVADMRKKLGDEAAKNETVAIIDSREVADAKSEYLAALANYDLQSKLFAREKGLFEKKITAEQLFLKAKAVFTEAKLRLDLARGKLAALDLSESEIAALPSQPIARLREKEIRAPIKGRIIERLVNLGQPVTAESQIYVMADLSEVEADLAVPVASLASVRVGQPVFLKGPDGRSFEGKVTIVNAMITPETRTGHVIASFKNPDFALHPGVLLNAEITIEQSPARVIVPRGAVQLVHNEPTIFVQTKDGFEKRAVELGDGDEASVEIAKGLSPGETIAVENSFVLKAEAGKSEIPEE